MLCQPCSGLWLIIIVIFKFGWLNLLQDPTFNQAGSSFMAHGSWFIALKFFYLKLSKFNWRQVKFRLKLCSPYLFCLFKYIHWTLSGMWNARIPKYCLLFTFLVPDGKDSKGKETPCELVGTHLWVDRLFGSTLKMLSKEANYFDVFYVQYMYIERRVVSHWKRSVVS